MAQEFIIKDWMKIIGFIFVSIGIIIVGIFLFDPAFIEGIIFWLTFIGACFFLFLKTYFKKNWKFMFLGALVGISLTLLHVVLISKNPDFFNYSPLALFLNLFTRLAAAGLCRDFGCLIFTFISIPLFVILWVLVGLLTQMALEKYRERK